MLLIFLSLLGRKRLRGSKLVNKEFHYLQIAKQLEILFLLRINLSANKNLNRVIQATRVTANHHKANKIHKRITLLKVKMIHYRLMRQEKGIKPPKINYNKINYNKLNYNKHNKMNRRMRMRSLMMNNKKDKNLLNNKIQLNKNKNLND